MHTAEEKIADALRSGTLKLNLSGLELSALPAALGQLRQLQSLNLYHNQMSALPEWVGQLTQLQSLNLSDNQLTSLPESIGQLRRLQSLDLSVNQLTTLPESLGKLRQLRSINLCSNQLSELPTWIQSLDSLSKFSIGNNLVSEIPTWLGECQSLRWLNLGDDAGGNPLTSLPACIGEIKDLEDLLASGCGIEHFPLWLKSLTKLQMLYLTNNKLTDVPTWIGQFENLQRLQLTNNKIKDLPVSLADAPALSELLLESNPLNPELEAAYNESFDAVYSYLRARAEAQVVLNEAKLVLIGEGEVGKSCLLAALRGDRWEESRPTTHGIEIKPVMVSDPGSGTEITLNGWDFGGQRVYRPTHQLFFSAPAVYLVVWKPREGPQQGFVKEWIKLVKHREPDAKILVVATHGGPKERQPDIDRQDIWELFGKETVVDFFFVDSKPPHFDEDKQTWVGDSVGIQDLRNAIARVAANLPEVGRSVPKRWDDTRKELKEHGAAYLPLETVLKLCNIQQMGEDEAKDFIRVAHRLGHLIHYAHDLALRDIVVLKPDWLSTAMSYVLDDKETRDNNGLVKFSRLGELWNDPARPAESRYDASLHPLFLRLMERFDLSYKVAVPAEPEDALGFWQRVAASVGTTQTPPAQLHYTSLIAQLVPDLRPNEEDIAAAWPTSLADGDGQQMQVCRIVETKSGQSANPEGLFYQLIVRLHKYSLGRVNYKQSIQWQRGLVLDDDYNGRALLEHVGNDVRITVRAAYPEAFLAVLTREVKYLVESFWAGLSCDVMVPCLEPCGKGVPGTGLFEVQKLIESKRQKRPDYPCSVCTEWQNIDCLLRNAPAARPAPLEALMGELATMRGELTGARQQLIALRGEAMGRFDRLDIGTQSILSRLDDAFTDLMQSLTDEAKEGPRLFSFQPVDPGFFDRPRWISQKFRLTLWCEHSRLPLPQLNVPDSKAGVYELNLPREWFEKAAPFLKVLIGTLSLVLPVAASATKLVLDDAAYKGLEKEFDLGEKSLNSVLKGGETSISWLGRSDAPHLEHGEAMRAQGVVLRQLHAWLKEQDPSYGGLVRVMNKRQEFLWVHPQFESKY
jgi:hypothetical protein